MQKPFEEAQVVIEEAKSTLIAWDRHKLTQLISQPLTEKRLIQGKEYEITKWAQDEPTEQKLSVIVEARRYRVLGWSQVAVTGFIRTYAGDTLELKESDLWALGY